MEGPLILRGLILAGEELEPLVGHVVVESGAIIEVAEGRAGGSQDIIIPGLINCHTHIGDYLFKDQGIGLPLDSTASSQRPGQKSLRPE
jgi:cytosine/adenosine deaminase-related metal-dependent hydrolase